MASKSKKLEAKVKGNAAVPPSPQKILGDILPVVGRMHLHKEGTRTETFYMYVSQNWKQLRDILANPIFFFDEIVHPGDALRGPVTVILKPAGDEYFLKSKSLISEAIANSPTYSRFHDLVIESVVDAFETLKSGSFIAEFANKTRLLTILYRRPEKVTEPAGYQDGYTIPTICTMEEPEPGEKVLGQIHFDLQPLATAHKKRQRADFTVDYIEDGGIRLVADLNQFQRYVEETTMETVVSSANPIDPVRNHLGKRTFKSKSARVPMGTSGATKSQLDGPEITLESLSDDVVYEYFVCLQSSAEVTPTIPATGGAAEVPGVFELDTIIVKVYVAPPGGG